MPPSSCKRGVDVTLGGGHGRVPLRNGRLPGLLVSGRAVGEGNVGNGGGGGE
jgi:hypothetical protein